jgi:hypothetical protein
MKHHWEIRKLRQHIMRQKIILLLLSILIGVATAPCRADGNAGAAYLSTSFHNADQCQLRFIHSKNGYQWDQVPGSFLKAAVGNKVLRDPSIARGKDGIFRLVWTSAWHGDAGFGYASSSDLIHWSAQKFIPVMTNEPTTVNVWAPEIFFDEPAGRFVITWASTIPGRFADLQEKHENNHRLYFTTTTNFDDFAPTKLFLDPGFSVIDPFILRDGSNYVLLCKDNSRPVLGLRVAFGDSPIGPWHDMSEPFTPKYNEGPCALKVGDDWLVYCDSYRKKTYSAYVTRDFKLFKDASSKVSFPPEHKHGTAFRVSDELLENLLKAGLASAAEEKLAPTNR